MKASNKLSGALAAALLTMLVPPAIADNPGNSGHPNVAAELTGYQETPATINTAASGEFIATARHDGSAIDYKLTYRNLSSPITQAHIHFGRPATSGGVVLFLCTTLTPPAGVPTPQNCPAAPATITGSLTALDVIPNTAQGIDAGATGFAEILQAVRAGATYANVHTTGHAGGEIRGRLFTNGHDDHH